MAKDVQALIAVRPDFQVKRGAVKHESGLTVQKLAKAIFDTALTDSSGVSNKTVATHGLGVFIPAKARIQHVWIDCKTGFTSAGSNGASIAVQAESAGDCVNTTAITATVPAGAGAADGAITSIATSVKTTAERELKVVVTADALTAGRLTVYAEYVIAE